MPDAYKLSATDSRASLVPAAAVIPAGRACVCAAVTKLVVEGGSWAARGERSRPRRRGHGQESGARVWSRASAPGAYFEPIRVFHTGERLKTHAWDNGRGLWSATLVPEGRRNGEERRRGGSRIAVSEVKFLDYRETGGGEGGAKDAFIDQERKLGDRR